MDLKNSIDLLGVHVDGLGIADVLRRITDHQTNNSAKPFWIVTVNPEILLYARNHTDYRNAINGADLRIADGVGIQLIASLTGRRVQRATGVDLAEWLVYKCSKRRESVCFIGGLGDTSQRALDSFKREYPGLVGSAIEGGNVSDTGEGDETNDEAFHQVTLMAPKLLLVAFGHPKQEMWIARCLKDMPSVNFIVGIGGAFDYWSGNAPRAPHWMRSLGLEWLHRLVMQPKRWRRIWNAVVVFPVFCVIDALFPKSK